MKDLTTEQYRLIYDEPVYPKNLYLDRAPYTHEEYAREVLRPNVARLQERGVYAAPDRGVPLAPEPEALPDGEILATPDAAG